MWEIKTANSWSVFLCDPTPSPLCLYIWRGGETLDAQMKQEGHSGILKDKMSHKESSLMPGGDGENLQGRSAADPSGESNLLCFYCHNGF